MQNYTVSKTYLQNTLNLKAKSIYNKIDDHNIHSLHWGNPKNPAIISLHGATANAFWFSSLAPVIKQNFYLISISYSGHGLSSWRSSYTLDNLFQEIEIHIDSLQHKPIITGHSFGALICLAYSLKHGDKIAGTILLDPPSHIIQTNNKSPNIIRKHRIHTSKHELMQRFKTIPEQPKHNPILHDYIAQNSIEKLSDGWRWQFDPNFFNRLVIDTPYTQAKLQKPCHIIYGQNSIVTTDYTISNLQKQYPNISSEQIKNAWHAIMLDQPIELLNAITKKAKKWTNL